MKFAKLGLVFSLIALFLFAYQNCAGGGGGGTVAVASIKYVFSTSQSFKGNLGGLAGADNLCSIAASAGGLSGNWKAWLSDSVTSALTRIDDVGPWYLVGTTVKAANNKNSFAVQPAVMIDRNENGGLTNSGAYPFQVWTGTNAGGVPGDTCTDWTVDTAPTAGTGVSIQPGNIWSVPGTTTCNATLHLVCLQQ